MSESKEIVATSRGVVLSSLSDMYRFAQYAVASQKGLSDKETWIPPTFKTAEQVMMAVQYGGELGLAPMQSLQVIYPVRGKAGIMGEAALALIMASGKMKEYVVQWEWGKKGETPQKSDEIPAGMTAAQMAEVNLTCCITTERTDIKGRTTYKYSVQDAVNQQLWGSGVNWSKAPKDMIFWRALGRCAHQRYADVVKGIGIREADFDIEETATPPETSPATPPAAPAAEMDTFDGTPIDTNKPIEVAPIAPVSVLKPEPEIIDVEFTKGLFAEEEKSDADICRDIANKMIAAGLGRDAEKCIALMAKKAGVKGIGTNADAAKVRAVMEQYAKEKGVQL